MDALGALVAGVALFALRSLKPLRPLVALRPLLRGYRGKVCTIDARRISEAALGRYFPNTPMLAAAVKVSGVIEPEGFMNVMEIAYRHKFATKPQVIEKNLACLKQSMKEVREG